MAGSPLGRRAERGGPGLRPVEPDLGAVHEHDLPDVVEPTEWSRRRLAAADAVTALHREVAKIVPVSTGWKRLTTSSGIEIDPLLIELAKDEHHAVLFDEEIYRAIVGHAEVPHNQQAPLWRLFHRAAALTVAAAKTPTSSPEVVAAKRSLAAMALGQEARAFTMQTLRLIDTEAGFIAHLNTLKDRAGLAVRPLAKAMKARHRHAPVHSTLANWFKGNTLPASAGEKMIGLLVEVLLEHVGNIPDVAAATAEHVRVYRFLIEQRHLGALRGPTRMAMEKLDAMVERDTRGKASGGPGFASGYRTGLRTAQLVLRDAVTAWRSGSPDRGEAMSGSPSPAA
jgi:hypothetical protein